MVPKCKHENVILIVTGKMSVFSLKMSWSPQSLPHLLGCQVLETWCSTSKELNPSIGTFKCSSWKERCGERLALILDFVTIYKTKIKASFFNKKIFINLITVNFYNKKRQKVASKSIIHRSRRVILDYKDSGLLTYTPPIGGFEL